MKVFFKTHNQYKPSKLLYEKNASFLFHPLPTSCFPFQKVQFLCMNTRYFDFCPILTPSKPQFCLIANRGQKLCCKNEVSELVQICIKNETDASTPRFSTSGLLEALLSCAIHPMAIFIPVWYLKPRIPIKSSQDHGIVLLSSLCGGHTKRNVLSDLIE